MFVGYCKDSKGYKLVKLSNKKLSKARDVIFFETRFAFCQQINEKQMMTVTVRKKILSVTADQLLSHHIIYHPSYH